VKDDNNLNYDNLYRTTNCGWVNCFRGDAIRLLDNITEAVDGTTVTLIWGKQRKNDEVSAHSTVQ
jgi:hypothetical protein